MEYRCLGKSGLKVSELSFGSWLTFASLENVRAHLRIAYQRGINFFDTAEAYGQGTAELLLGEAIREFRREALVISTKVFWGGKGPNDEGLNKKHLVEGVKNSLRRLQLSYVDLLFCHRADSGTPIEETVRAMETLIQQGVILYWGTSEWSAGEIESAHEIARELRLTPPAMEQPEYNLFNREKMEREFLPLFQKYGMGTTIWSPLNSGILTGKYAHGIPPGSRLEKNSWLASILTEEKINKVNKLASIAAELNCTLAQLAIAWCLKNRHVSTVLLGSTSPEQLIENLKASEVKERLDDSVMQRIERILNG